MKTRSFLLLVMSAMLLFTASCRQAPGGGDGSSDPGEPVQSEQSEQRQYMAYHFGNAARVGDDLYFVSGTSFSKAQIFASEYGAADFEPFVPCFDAVCNHSDRTKCCITTELLSGRLSSLSAFQYGGEPAVLLFNPVDICFSRPYSDLKLNLVVENFVVKGYPKDDADADSYMEAVASKPVRSNPFIYKEKLYYSELKDGVRTQYRIPITGGKPERVFEQDDIIIKTIINDRFYGIRYDDNAESNTNAAEGNGKVHYFRSDMDYKNIELLPEILDLFDLTSNYTLRLPANVILDADRDFIYIMHDMKILKIPDSDINAEPILLSDMTETAVTELPQESWNRMWYNDGKIYLVLNTDVYYRSLLNLQGDFPSKSQWYETSMLYSFDIQTGEYNVNNISDQNYLMTNILYATDKYVYAHGIYVHDDNRVMQGVTMRLTLDTMRYEVILPDRFWEYSAEITGD